MTEEKLNCWEFENCGRGPVGWHTGNRSACIASTEKRTDGVNSGRNGGRTCWAIAGTECGGKPQCPVAQNVDTCESCLFCLIVMEEEHPNYVGTKRILRMLR
jgi:hypothetical protein